MKNNKPADAKNRRGNGRSKNGSERKRSAPVAIVGLGASAGGIQALQEFFGQMSSESSLAFVVVMHLSPEHESNLAAILQTQTSMPVLQVNEAIKVERDHIYVIPPNKHLAMIDGMVTLSDPQQQTGRRIAIDLFFRTLAEQYGQRSVCIVLSGTDSDGVIGLKHIKAQGGVTIAQEPAEAEYDSMPRHAIETGMVDWVLPVGEMPKRLLAYVENEKAMTLPAEKIEGDGEHEHEGKAPGGPLVAKQTDDPDDETALREVLAFLRSQTGHDFSHYKRATVLRRIARRLQVNSLETIPAYLDFLRTHAHEASALLRDLLICVTHFFRDPDAFAVLEAHIPQLFAGKTPNDQVRVWVPACATGEEAYSIAMMLFEQASRLERPPSIQVFATDLDDEVVRDAREGIYPATIEADVSQERLRRFFFETHGRYRIRKEVRELVLFAEHDLLRDSPFSRLDLVSCRNLLIYLKPAAQHRVLDIFHFALRPGGLLFIGGSENIDDGRYFAVLDKRQRLYTRRSTPPRPPTVQLLPRRARAEEKPAVLPRLATPPAVSELAPAQGELPPLSIDQQRLRSLGELHLGLLEQYAPPSVIVDENYDILHLSDKAGAFLQLPAGEPSANLLKIVLEPLRLELRTALFRAARGSETVTVPRIRLPRNQHVNFVDLHIRPSPPDAVEKFFLVIFEEKSASREEQAEPATAAPEPVTRQLEEELQEVRSQLNVTVEQYEASGEELKASNEELQAMNEELRSASEELETSKEELQSINEELTTVNQELKNNLEELNRTNSDLQNLMASTDMATIFLDRELRIKRYTPRVQELFNMIPTDVGRPLSDITSKLNYPELVKDAEQVLRDLTKHEREVKKRGNGWFLARLAPYRTLDDKINGVVVNFIDVTERRTAEEALRQSEEEFRRGVREVPIPMIMQAEDGQVLQISRSWTELTGYTMQEIPNFDAWLNKAYGFGGEDVRERMRRTFHGQGPLEQIDFNIVTRAGKKRTWSFTASPIGVLRDGRRFIVGMALDVTERNRAQEALRVSEERFRAVANLVPDLLWSTDGNGAADWFNQRWIEYTGQTPEQTAGDGWLDAVHPDERGEVQRKFRAAIAANKPMRHEQRFRSKEGEYRWFLVQKNPLRNEAGEAIRWFAAASDIHEQRTASDAVRESEERFRYLVEGARDYAIFLLDPNNTIIHWNSGAERVFGWTAEEAIGKSGRLVFTLKDRKTKQEEQEIAIAMRDGSAPDKRWHLRKDGTRIWVDGVMHRLDDPHTGALRGFAKIARDATAEHEAKEDLERRVQQRTIELTKSNRKLRVEMDKRILLEQRILTIGERERRRIGDDLHDSLCQELAATAFFLETEAKKLEKARPRDATRFAEAARLVNKNVGLARDLARGLHPVGLRSGGLLNALRELAFRASQHNVVCRCDGARNVRVPDQAVSLNLYRIAAEAVNNSLKHAKPRNIVIELRRTGSVLLLQVRDDGKGFKTESHRKGMGLEIMCHRANVIGGQLQVESRTGAGTTVTCTVPGE